MASPERRSVSHFRLPHTPQLAPSQYRANFAHLYGDIVWYGVLNGSNIAFVNVFAARQGATPFEVGLLTAGPAVVNFIFALPSAYWLKKQPVDTAVFWTSVLTRVFYLLWIPLPWLLVAHLQVWALIGLTLVMSIPATALVVGFNDLFAQAVPPEWRSNVSAIRNALLAVASMISTLACGVILSQLPFPTGYQVVFGIGLMGAALSSLNFWFLRPATEATCALRTMRSLRRLSWPTIISPRQLLHQGGKGLLRTEILRSRFGRAVAVLFTFHLFQYLPMPLFAVYFVTSLHLSDQQISLGAAASYVTNFMGALALTSFTRRFGYQRVTGIGAAVMVFYPGLMALANGVELFLAASLLGGLGWGLMSSAFLNYILERVPQDDRPAHLAWYNLAFNAAILVGSLIGPLIATQIGLAAAMGLFAIGRLVSGLCIVRWG